MALYAKYIPISMEKLKLELSKKGHTITDVSMFLGCNPNYISAQFSRNGGIKEYTIRTIEKDFHIPRESFVISKISQPKEQADDTSETIALLKDINRKLELLIGSQVKVFGHIDDGIEGQSAIIHLMERLEDTIFKAVDKAWRQ